MIPSVVSASAPELVKTASGQSIFHTLLAILGAILIAMIVTWRVWLKGAPERAAAQTAADAVKSDGEEQMRKEMWEEIATLKLRDEEKGRRISMAEARIAGQTVRLGQQAFVITMLLDEIERLSPGNTIARSAKALINMQADQMPNADEIAPMADIMSKLCVEPGSKRN